MTVDNKNVIHSKIFVFLNKDNMAPLTFDCEALPIVKKHLTFFRFHYPYSFSSSLQTTDWDVWTTNTETQRDIRIGGMLFTAPLNCIAGTNNDWFQFA